MTPVLREDRATLPTELEETTMSFNLRNRSLLTVQDYTQREFRYLLDLARDLKRAKYARTEQEHLKGKEICLIFEKTSTRTRCAFEVACHDQGANVTYLDPAGSQIGHKESFKDTARVLGRMFDALEYRGASQTGVETLAKYAGVPVFNGLTDEYHPTQMLADVMTMREHSDKPLSQIAYAFMGDTRNNMGHSLMIVGCLMGMDVRLCGPKKLWPADEYVAIARELEKKYGATLTITDDPKKAVKGVDFIHTDVWVSMGEPKEVWKERIKLLLPYQVNAKLMKASGNAQVKFMHCLPAFHDTETTLGKQLAEEHGIDNGLEVTNDVFESEWNIAFEQAENRLHTIKAILVATLGD
jgi:ornithine carbamoyltransferase